MVLLPLLFKILDAGKADTPTPPKEWKKETTCNKNTNNNIIDIKYINNVVNINKTNVNIINVNVYKTANNFFQKNTTTVIQNNNDLTLPEMPTRLIPPSIPAASPTDPVNLPILTLQETYASKQFGKLLSSPFSEEEITIEYPDLSAVTTKLQTELDSGYQKFLKYNEYALGLTEKKTEIPKWYDNATHIYSVENTSYCSHGLHYLSLLSFAHNELSKASLNVPISGLIPKEITIKSKQINPPELKFEIDYLKSVSNVRLWGELGVCAFENESQPKEANLGYLVERIARVLGISIYPDRSIKSIRQKRYFPTKEDLPEGWNLGQFGENEGGKQEGQLGGNQGEFRDGIIYEIRSNQFNDDETEIQEGGYLLCENWPQYFDAMLDDLDKALGWQAAGASVLKSADNSSYSKYEGLNSLLQEANYMLSFLSKHIQQTHLISLTSQQEIEELMSILGLPIHIKKTVYDTGVGNPNANPGDGTGDSNSTLKADIPYFGYTSESPKIFQLFTLLLMNLGLINSSMLELGDVE